MIEDSQGCIEVPFDKLKGAQNVTHLARSASPRSCLDGTSLLLLSTPPLLLLELLPNGLQLLVQRRLLLQQFNWGIACGTF